MDKEMKTEDDRTETVDDRMETIDDQIIGKGTRIEENKIGIPQWLIIKITTIMME